MTYLYHDIYRAHDAVAASAKAVKAPQSETSTAVVAASPLEEQDGAISSHTR